MQRSSIGSQSGFGSILFTKGLSWLDVCTSILSLSQFLSSGSEPLFSVLTLNSLGLGHSQGSIPSYGHLVSLIPPAMLSLGQLTERDAIRRSVCNKKGTS